MKAVLTVLVLCSHVSPLYAQAARLNIVHISPEAVEVRESGRMLGRTPAIFEVPSGVQRLAVGETSLCVYVAPGATAEIVLVAGKLETIARAIPCEQAKSEIILTGLPMDAHLAAPEGTALGAGTTRRIQVDVPTRVAITITHPAYHTFSSSIEVGARERRHVAVKLGPRMPPLLADTVIVPVPDPLPDPQYPPIRPEPVDRRLELSEINTREAVLAGHSSMNGMRSMGNAMFSVGAGWTVILVVLASVDSQPNPELARPFLAAAGSAVVGWIIKEWADGSLQKNSARAGCGGYDRKRTAACHERLRVRQRELKSEVQTYPAQRSAWEREKVTADSIHAINLETWRQAAAHREMEAEQAREHNRKAQRNREENARRISAWGPSARAMQRLELLRVEPRR